MDEETLDHRTSRVPASLGMASWLAVHSGGMLKDEKHASRFLLITASLLIIVALYFAYSSFRGPEALDAREVQQIIQNQQGARAPMR